MTALVVPASASSERSAAARQLHFSVRFTGFHQQVQSTTKAHAGDRVEFTDRLSQGKSTVGHDAAVCTHVDVKRYECDWTLFLAGGSIQIAGIAVDTNNPYHLAVIGGTGKYVGASGTLTVTDANKQVAHYAVALTG